MVRTPVRAAAIAAAALIFSAQLRVAPPGERPDTATLELLLRRLASSGTFMQTDAHPDDEDNGLLAMLGRGQGMRTALVTLTRGDGGQNEIGPELGQSLGVLRTEELLAVHRFDGAEQYFTRALDFGYSFSVDESIQKWGHDEILGDLVRHIRTIRPDVVAGFLCGGQSGGLHHQASAVLTREAFRAAADPARYPDQITDGLRPWQPLRYFCTDENAFAPQPPPRTADMLLADVSGYDAALGRTYAELGLEARSMHKCQGTSQLLLLPGQSQNRTYRLQDTVLAATGLNAGATPSPSPMAAGTSLFDGIDVSLRGLSRFTGGRSVPALESALRGIQQSVIDATAASRARGPAAAIVPLVAGLRATRALEGQLPAMLAPLQPVAATAASGGTAGSLLGGVENHPDASTAVYEIHFRLEQKERQFQDALAVAAAVRVDALADDGVVVPGQNVTVTLYASAPAGSTVQLRGATLAGFDGAIGACGGELAAPITCKGTVRVPATTHLSTPYWTARSDAARYDFEPDVPFGVPFRPTPFRAAFDVVVGGERISIERAVEYRYSNLVAGEKRSQLNVSPDFNVAVDPDIAVFPLAAMRQKTVNVTVVNNQKGAAASTVSLQAPDGWRVDPASQPVRFSREDESVTVKFAVQPPAGAAAGSVLLNALASSETGARSRAGYDVVEYPHIHRRHVVHDASIRAKLLDVTVPAGLEVGYVMGVGDRVPEAIEQLGASVTLIDAETLAAGDLSRFDAIVLGVRAYERRPDLRANNQRLLQYAGNGGTVVVQYQRTEFNDAQYGPYPAKTTAERITDENAPVEVLVPDHPLFNTPNRIGPDAWRGWIQERGTYFLGERDARYVDLLRSEDPFPYNAGPKTGILVEARVGKGRWLYTGLGLWRQLPAGTDGAYRLLANLISLGKQ